MVPDPQKIMVWGVGIGSVALKLRGCDHLMRDAVMGKVPDPLTTPAV